MSLAADSKDLSVQGSSRRPLERGLLINWASASGNNINKRVCRLKY